MKIWYSCKIKHNKEMEDGLLKQATDVFLLDAVSYTDAESRLYSICERDISGEFTVHQITKTNIAEVIPSEDADLWFKGKVVYATVDGDSEKEVKINTYLLVSGKDVKDVYDKIHVHLTSMLVPFEIPSITLTTILDVYPYDSEDEKTKGLTPLSSIEDKD